MRMKKGFIIIFSGLLFMAGIALALPPKINPLPSDYRNAISWQKAQELDKPIVINFYVDWCHACRRFAPLLEALRKEYNSKYTFVFIKTDDPANERLVKKFNIRSFPSLFLVDGDREVFVKQRKYYDLEKMRKELDAFLEKREN